MDRIEAFQVVATACANVSTTLPQHQQIQQALSVLKEIVEPKENDE